MSLSSASLAELQLADHSDSSTSVCSPPLAVHSDYNGESVQQDVDLNGCTALSINIKMMLFE